MTHTSAEVRKIVTKALAASTRQWVPAEEEGLAAVQRARSELDRHLIAPEQGMVMVDQQISLVLGVEVGLRSVWFLTAPGTQRVFFDETSAKFGVAWGPEVVSGEYIDLGFRTDDPIDAYLA